jgi:hypothetical protein
MKSALFNALPSFQLNKFEKKTLKGVISMLYSIKKLHLTLLGFIFSLSILSTKAFSASDSMQLSRQTENQIKRQIALEYAKLLKLENKRNAIEALLTQLESGEINFEDITYEALLARTQFRDETEILLSVPEFTHQDEESWVAKMKNWLSRLNTNIQSLTTSIRQLNSRLQPHISFANPLLLVTSRSFPF